MGPQDENNILLPKQTSRRGQPAHVTVYFIITFTYKEKEDSMARYTQTLMDDNGTAVLDSTSFFSSSKL
ncbi:MAG: hypothetical protein WCS17_10410 [Prevotella sp.]